MRRVPFGTRVEDKKSAVFLVIYSKSISPWKYFKDDISVESCAGFIMVDRWDGRVGFAGGMIDDGEELKTALKREIFEEIGIHVKVEKVHPIVSFESKIVTHLFGLEVNEMEFMHIYYHILNNFARSILLHAYEEGDKSRFLSETTGIKIVPVVSHNGKGIDNFITNNFAGNARADLLVFLDEVVGFDISKLEY